MQLSFDKKIKFRQNVSMESSCLHDTHIWGAFEFACGYHVPCT